MLVIRSRVVGYLSASCPLLVGSFSATCRLLVGYVPRKGNGRIAGVYVILVGGLIL